MPKSLRQQSPENELVQQERILRANMWDVLREKGGSSGVEPTLIRDLGIYGGAQGIWVDKKRTGRIAADGAGVTVGVLHTGRSYADELSADTIIYHYPNTKRPSSRDLAEVNATKNAARLELPVFVITSPTPKAKVRDVVLGWVESWDDESQCFLIAFGDTPPQASDHEFTDRTPFVLTVESPSIRQEVNARSGQQRFKFEVLKRYGPECAVCGLQVSELLDAAHIKPKNEQGTDDPRNGLVLCANHHRAFDAGLFMIDPTSLSLICHKGGPNLEALGLRSSISQMRNKPHVEALLWRWESIENIEDWLRSG